MSMEERLKKLFAASSEQLEAIDAVLEPRKMSEEKTEMTAPLLLGMAASAKLLGVSRVTLWRMIKGGSLQKVEVLPGSFRLRHADLLAVVANQKIDP